MVDHLLETVRSTPSVPDREGSSKRIFSRNIHRITYNGALLVSLALAGCRVTSTKPATSAEPTFQPEVSEPPPTNSQMEVCEPAWLEGVASYEQGIRTQNPTDFQNAYNAFLDVLQRCGADNDHYDVIFINLAAAADALGNKKKACEYAMKALQTTDFNSSTNPQLLLPSTQRIQREDCSP